MSDDQRRIRLLVVDDSLLFRSMLNIEMVKEPDLEIVAMASDPYEARDKIVLFDPDVMILDINLPRMNGVEFIKRLMAQYPIPVVVISSIRDCVSEAIRAGAMDGLEKPRAGGERNLAAFVSELKSKVRTSYSNDPRRAEKSRAGAKSAGRTNHIYPENRVARSANAQSTKALIAIGASTGGTNAIADIITALPAGLPGIVIVQHMPAEFTGMFAQRLNSICAFPVYEAENGNKVLPNTALVAPGNQQLRVVKNADELSVHVHHGEKVSGHCPSVDVMFASVAECAGSKAIGVLLTGMGQDGANGLLSMRKAGARTIGQDEKSSVVYGMPKVANDIGAVTYQLPLNQIASKIVALL